MTRQLGVAVVGLGVGAAHAQTYAALDRCDLRWFHDLDERRAHEVQRALARGRVATAFSDILEDGGVDLVSIASYDDAHFEQVVKALEAGKHVFVEKPLSRTIDELRTVKTVWTRARRQLASNLILRAAPLYKWLKEIIQNGRMGEIYAIDGDYLYGRLEKITAGWRRDVKNYSVMHGGGVHLLDLMLWLTEQRPANVTAAGNRIASRGTGFSYRDFVAATFQFPSGIVGRVSANFGCVHRHQHVLRVFGTAATFIYDDRGARLHESRDPHASATPIDLPSEAASKGALIPGFVEAILTGRDCSSETQLDLDVLCACAAADRAVETGAVTDVTYV